MHGHGRSQLWLAATRLRQSPRGSSRYGARADRGRSTRSRSNGSSGPACARSASKGRHRIDILAAKFRAGLQEKTAEPATGPACEKCRSWGVVASGHRLNKSGAVRRFHCKTCDSYFSCKEGFHKRRSDPDVIAKALDLHFRGTSLQQVAEHFAQAYSLPVSDTIVYRWVTHYCALAAEWIEKQGAKVGATWHVDERVVNGNGEHRFLWNVMDSATRFLLACRISKWRGVPEARLALREPKESMDVLPVEIRSDGLPAYPGAIKREFGRHARPGDAPNGPRLCELRPIEVDPAEGRPVDPRPRIEEPPLAT
jgi:transposase-like protein